MFKRQPMKRATIPDGFGGRLLVAAPKRNAFARAGGCAVESLEGRTLLAATTETFTGGKGPFTSTFEYFNNQLIPRGISDGFETIQLTSGLPFQVVNFKLTHNGGSGSVTRVKIVGRDVANAVIYDNQFNTPVSQSVIINVNTKVKLLEFHPITVLQNGQQFVDSGVLRTILDDFQYDPQVAANTPPQLTGMGAGTLGSFRENGQLSIFANPAQGINAAIQDSDNDIVAVEVQQDDPDRGLMIGSDVDGDGKYFTPVQGRPDIVHLTGTPAQVTSAIRELYMYFINVDDVTDTGRDYTMSFTVRIDDGHNPVVTGSVQGVVHGVNEAPTITSSANPVSTLLNQFTYDRDFITPFSTFTIDDPDSKPVLPAQDVLPDELHVDIGFPDANGALVIGRGWSKSVSLGVATYRFVGDYAEATQAVRRVQFDPADKFTPGLLTTTNFTIKVTDSGDPFDNDPVRGAPLSFTFGSPVSVVAKTNTSPTLAGGPITRGVILEGVNSAAFTVASLVSSPNAMADVDTDQRKGVAIVAASGSWQYSTDGTTWTNFGAVSPTAALVLGDATQVRFGGSDANGPLSFTYKAWDRSSWPNNVGGTGSSAGARVLVDASQFSTPPQNVSPFSLASVANNQPVTAINDAPNVINGPVASLGSIPEDTAQPVGYTVAGAFAAFFSDADDDQAAIGGSSANTFAGVAVVANAQTPAAGTWQYKSAGAPGWTDVGTAVSNAAALLLAPDAMIRFVPVANFNGQAPALTLRLVEDSSGPLTTGTTADVSVNGDPTRYSAGTLATQLLVQAVNDAPLVVNGTTVTLSSVAEDNANPAGTTVSGLFASHYSDAADQVPGGSSANPFGGVAVIGNAATAAQGKWQYGFLGSWTDISSGVTPSAAVMVNAIVLLRFLPAADFNGAGPALTVRLLDDSQGTVTTGFVVNTTANGGITAISTGSVTLGTTVTEVNDAPVAANDTLANVAEDTGPWSIPFATLLANDSKGPANEATQSLVMKSVGGAVGGSVQIDGTNVVFTPTSNYFGVAGFTYTAEDNGTTNGSAAPSTSGAANVGFFITAVNDAPTIASLSAAPDPVVAPAPVTLTAAGVADVDGAVAQVSFYRESNGTPGLQTGAGGDTLLGTDANSAGGYTLDVPTTGLAAGNYTCYAQAADTLAALGNVASATHSVVVPSGPRVQAVYVNSTLWSQAFYTYLAQNNLGDARGWRVAAGAGQLQVLPWTTLDQINLAFDQDADVNQGDLQVRGVNSANYAFATFSYDDPTRTARWTMAPGSVVTADKLLLDLDGDAGGVTGTGPSAGMALDGDWTDSAGAYPSGNGTPGGDFRFRFNILPGDTGRDGAVLADDFSMVKKKFFKTASSPVTGTDADYSAFHDVDGSGGILANDFSEVKKRFFDALPAGNPVPLVAASNSLFGTEPVRLADELLA
jgi:hypothetical protein